MRILLFTSQFWNLTGGEVNVRDWATGFKSRGHSVIVYTPVAGPLADRVRAQGIPVISDPAGISDTPDVIFGSGINDAITLATRFPETPIVQVSQQWDSWASHPCPLSQAVLHVAVDELNGEMLVNEFGVDRERLRIVYNAVDMTRMPGRKRPLAPVPERMLVFVKQYGDYVDDLRSICGRRGIALDLIGYAVGNPVDNPLEILGDYDIVVGAARTAIEACVAGAAVLVADHRGFAGMLTASNLEHFRRHNFGREVLQRPVDAARLESGIDAYDPAAASIASDIMQKSATLERQMLLLEEIFEEALTLFRRSPASAVENRKALSTYLALHLPRHGEISPRQERFMHPEPVADRFQRLEQRLDRIEQRIAASQEAEMAPPADAFPGLQTSNLLVDVWKLNTVIAESEIAECRLHREDDDGTRIYSLEARGGLGEHYIVFTVPPQQGQLSLTLEVREEQRVAGLRLQLLDDMSNGVIGDIDFSDPYRMTTQIYGHVLQVRGGAYPIEAGWLACWVGANFPVSDKPVRVILQLRDADGSHDFLPDGQTLFLRAVRLRKRAPRAERNGDTS